MAKRLNESDVVRILSRKRDIKLKPMRRHAEILKSDSVLRSHDLGNKSWGKIDFLTSKCKWTVTYVDKFSKS